MSRELPEEFIKWSFFERRELVEKMIKGELKEKDFLVGFLRHTPAIVTDGPAGLNASIKGIGFVPKEEVLEDVTKKLKEALNRPRDMKAAAKFLLEYVYNENYIDFHKLSTIELAKKHTWENLQHSDRATILFFMPPETTYEVRCKATIHTQDLYWEYANTIHDLFHVPNTPEVKRWSERPVYIFEIEEIYDNNPRVMGKKIY